jgi:GNAT superfamily N-acetyltransferase
MSASRIAIAKSVDEIRECHAVMRELRTHIHNAERLAERVERQQREGYQLAYLTVDDEIRAVAGYRLMESLFSGKFLYVDDLVTREGDRSRGYGGELFDWLMQQARQNGCESLELDSGIQRSEAHRFYLLKRMHISSYHFRIKISHEK